MALLYTPQPEMGLDIPKFELPTVDGKTFSSSDIKKGQPAVIAFMCNHCPYVKAIEDRLISLAARLQSIGVPFIGICANDPAEYPEDAPDQLLERWTKKNYKFPYLVDTTQDVAKRFGAVCTPDFFVYNKDLKLSYRGRLDDSWKDPSKVTREELWGAVIVLKEGKTIAGEQRPSMGCSIKWKKN